MRLSPVELIVILVVVFALFGGTLIPKVMKRVKNSKNVLKAEMENMKEQPVAESVQ